MNYLIRDYQRGDETAITRLFEETFGKPMTPEQWRWKYRIAIGKPYAKLAVTPSGTIVGCVGAIPLRGIMAQQPLPFFQIVDVMVHADHRGHLGSRNLFLRLITRLLEAIGSEFGEVLAYGFPGQRSFPLAERAGVYGRITRARDYTVAAQDHGFSLLRIQPLDWHDPRLNALWQRRSRQFGLALVRDADYLHWRYAESPFYTYRLFGLFCFTRLLGWAVTRDDGEQILLIDLLVGKSLCAQALRAFSGYFERAGKHRLRLWLPDGWAPDYPATESEIVVTNMVWKLPLATRFVQENLFYTLGDTDVF